MPSPSKMNDWPWRPSITWSQGAAQTGRDVTPLLKPIRKFTMVNRPVISSSLTGAGRVSSMCRRGAPGTACVAASFPAPSAFDRTAQAWALAWAGIPASGMDSMRTASMEWRENLHSMCQNLLFVGISRALRGVARKHHAVRGT
jgi:hypothetical protein